jgi:hypothetical protein
MVMGKCYTRPVYPQVIAGQLVPVMALVVSRREPALRKRLRKRKRMDKSRIRQLKVLQAGLVKGLEMKPLQGLAIRVGF